MDRGAWWATVHGVTKRQTRLGDFTFFLADINEATICRTHTITLLTQGFTQTFGDYSNNRKLSNALAILFIKVNDREIHMKSLMVKPYSVQEDNCEYLQNFFFFAGLIKRQTNKIWHGEHYYHLAQNLEFGSCVLLVSVLKKCLRKVTKDADEGTHQDKDAARQPGENNLTRLVTLGFHHQSSAFQGQGWGSIWVMAISWHTMTFITIW